MSGWGGEGWGGGGGGGTVRRGGEAAEAWPHSGHRGRVLEGAQKFRVCIIGKAQNGPAGSEKEVLWLHVHVQ